MKKSTSIHLLSGAAAAALTLLPAAAMASAPRHEVASTDRVIYFYDYLTAGTAYTYETNNMTGTSPDTVLHVLSSVSGSWQQYAANDDCGSLRSCVTFTPPTTGYYVVWVHGYGTSTAGKTDLIRNGTVLLTQADFGGRRIYDDWAVGDTFQAPGTMNKTGLDTMMFLIPFTAGYQQHDDDSGPNLYPYVVASAASWGSAVVGAYPGSTVGQARYIHDVAISAGTDGDGDGISNGMEGLIGGNASSADSDVDTIPDNLELLGNNGWSFSEWGRYVGRDGFVEIDYMTHPTDPTKTRQPYANLPADVAEIFSTDSGGQILMTLFIDDSIAWHEVTCLGPCGGGVVDGVNFDTVKASSFSTWNAERRPYFHYTIWAYRHSSNSNTSSGIAEIFGNDLIVSLGAWSHTQGEQRGTFVHEFGHNLGFGHNGNGNNNGANSTIHESVMNYRYQIGGVPPSGRHTYSTGPSNQCASCLTSPKQGCVDLKNAGQCGTPAGATCDCDLDEWGTVNLDFRNGGQIDGVANAIGARSAEPDEKVEAPAPPDVAAYDEPVQARRARARQRVADLQARGEHKGRDFAVSDDGLHVYSMCK